MFKKAVCNWRVASQFYRQQRCIQPAMQQRGIRKRSLGISVEELESQSVPITKQVRELVNPSEHTRIKAARLLEQSNFNSILPATGSRNQKYETLEKLEELYSKAMVDTKGSLGREEYAAFLEGFCQLQDTGGCLRVLRDMRINGETPVTTQYAMVLKMSSDAFNARALFAVSEEMQAAGVSHDDSFFNNLLRCLGRTGQIEFGYSVYQEMLSRKVSPMATSYAPLIAGLASIDEVPLALQVMREALGRGVAFGQETYLELLHGAGKRMHHEAYKFCYTQLTTVFESQITEGDFLLGLSVAARNGDIALASDIVQQLQRLEYPLEEIHFEPLLDALIYRAQWQPAFNALGMMRKAGYGTTPATLRTLTRKLTVAPSKAEGLADLVYETLCASSKELPQIADAVTLNAMVAGLAQSGCVEAAMMRLTTWYDRLEIPRTVDSYAVVLAGCVPRRNKTVAEVLLSQMLDKDRLQPNKRVYESMIHVSLLQPNYEDAFVYLEAMKTQGIVPDWRTFASIARRCARMHDGRANKVIEEMRKLKMAVTPALLSYVQSFGDSSSSSSPDDPTLSTILDSNPFTV
ncbi:hypothetical protein IWW36_004539 [Coemansia brasiliensis]|uniref:Uncharacterized protein n=1 Tax=Coemansia brasiliensis TaxID=2650707 RepID=A0A9W8IAJ9_9FUNG|nr:hypothetical protein IWW36_004539 [Coemansia brasiliensis]